MKNTMKKSLWMICVIILLGIIAFSTIKLFTIKKEYDTSAKEYEKILSDTTNQYSSGDKQQFTVDFEKLQSINKDIVAWIRFEEPEIISYPVVQGTDNDYYLHHTFEKKKNKSGSIFIDYEQKNDFTEQNTFIYGHNMKDGTMFGRLRKYRSKEFWEKHPYFYIYTPDGGEKKYEIFSAHTAETGDDTYEYGFPTEEGFKNYIEKMIHKSAYKTEVEALSSDSIITLSTCTSADNDDERFIVHAKLVEED